MPPPPPTPPLVWRRPDVIDHSSSVWFHLGGAAAPDVNEHSSSVWRRPMLLIILLPCGSTGGGALPPTPPVFVAAPDVIDHSSSVWFYWRRPMLLIILLPCGSTFSGARCY